MIEMVLNTLPKIAAEIAAPLCNVERIKIVSGEGGEIGISRLTGWSSSCCNHSSHNRRGRFNHEHTA